MPPTPTVDASTLLRSNLPLGPTGPTGPSGGGGNGPTGPTGPGGGGGSAAASVGWSLIYGG